MATTSTGISLSSITTDIGAIASAAESNLKTTITNLPTNPSTADLLVIQSQVQQWTLTTDIQSTITKTLGDALKGIIQKAG